jgi:hypothetical protein
LDGTIRYVQNIAAVTGQMEKHVRQMKSGDAGKTFRPVSFSFPILPTVRGGRKLRRVKEPFDVVYMIDATGSIKKIHSSSKG